MTDETRLNAILDLVEQARSEGDKETEARAIAAYRRESNPDMEGAIGKGPPSRGPAPSASQQKPESLFGWGQRSGITPQAAANTALRGANQFASGFNSAVLSPVTATADAGSAIYNKVTGDGKAPYLSRALQNWQNESSGGTPRNAGENALQIAGGFAGGMILPMPKGPKTHPTPPSKEMQTFQQMRGSGYVAPPGSVKNSRVSEVVDALLGKEELLSEAQKMNQRKGVANLADEFNLPKGTEVTPESMKAVITEAGKGYEAIKSLGPKYEALVDRIRLLRSDSQRYAREAARNYNVRADNSAISLKADADQLESFLAEQLKNDGKTDLMEEFLKARTLIAKAHDTEVALIKSTGEIKPQKFGKAYDADKPLSGALMELGRSADAFPEAFKYPQAGGSTLSKWDKGILSSSLVGGAGLYQLAGNPAAALTILGLAGGRIGARKLRLSDAMQDLMMLSPELKKKALAEATLKAGAASQSNKGN